MPDTRNLADALTKATAAQFGVTKFADDGEATVGEAVQSNDARLSNGRPPVGPAGGVLAGNYPNPTFSTPVATQAALDATNSALAAHAAVVAATGVSGHVTQEWIDERIVTVGGGAVITDRANLPAAIAYEDEANVFTAVSNTFQQAVSVTGALTVAPTTSVDAIATTVTRTELTNPTIGANGISSVVTAAPTAISTAQFNALFMDVTTDTVGTTNMGTIVGIQAGAHFIRPAGNLTNLFGFSTVVNDAGSTGNISNLNGFRVNAAHFGIGTVANLTGYFSNALLRASGGAVDGNATTAIAYDGSIGNFSTAATPGVIATGIGLRISTPQSTGAITTVYGVRILNQGRTGAPTATTTAYGLYLDLQNSAGTSYAIYSNGGQSYHAGNIGIGVTVPTAVLHLKAGTASPNSAPLKLTQGVNMSVMEPGAIEYDGTDLWFTNATARNKLGTVGVTGSSGVAKTGDTMTGPLGIITAPTAMLEVGQAIPASVATTPGTAALNVMNVTGGVGGDTTIATTGVGGVGATTVLTAGTGGQALSAITSSTGGAGGQMALFGGVGGAAAVGGTGSNTGGAGGLTTVRGGGGGVASGATSGTNTGGVGGAASLLAGNGGNASGGSGTHIAGNGGVATFASGNGGTVSGSTGTAWTAGTGGALSAAPGLGGNNSVVNAGTNTGGTGGAGTYRGGSGGIGSLSTTANVGGIGGVGNFNGGTGGNATIANATASSTGGQGGVAALAAGAGGAATNSGGPSATGGVGGNTNVFGGTGGAATLATTNTGGAGGNLDLRGGTGGAGSPAGAGGSITIRTSTTTSAAIVATIDNLQHFAIGLQPPATTASVPATGGLEVQATNNPATLTFRRVDTNIISGEQLAGINFTGDDPTVAVIGAAIRAYAAATWAAGTTQPNTGTSLRFYTAPNAPDIAETERMRIEETGSVAIGTTAAGADLVRVQKDQDAATISRVYNNAALGNVNAAAQMTVQSFDSSGFWGAFPSDFTTARYRKNVVVSANSTANALVFQASGAAQEVQVYAGSASVYSRFVNSQLGIAMQPTAALTLPAGTTFANTAPLKLTQGSNVTVIEPGAIEYDGTDFWVSTALPTPARNKLATKAGIERTMGWYDLAAPSVGAVTGPVYTLRNAATVVGANGHAITPPTTTVATVDIEYSTDGGTVWNTLFTTTKPTFALTTGAFVAGTLTTTALPAGTKLRRKWIAVNGIADVTVQLDLVTA